MNINAFKCPVRGMLIYVGQSLAATWRLEEAVPTDVDQTTLYPAFDFSGHLQMAIRTNNSANLKAVISCNLKAEQSQMFQMIMKKVPTRLQIR